jgi:O-antigen ligase
VDKYDRGRNDDVTFQETVPPDIILSAHLHNGFLDIMAQGGTLGIVSYLALYLPFIFLALRRLKSSDIRIRSWSVLTLVLIGQYFALNMTDPFFAMNPLVYIFWMLMGLAYLQMQPNTPSASTKNTG